MTSAGEAFLFAGAFSCLLGAVIAMLYFGDRLRSDLLAGFNGPFEHLRFRRRP